MNWEERDEKKKWKQFVFVLCSKFEEVYVDFIMDENKRVGFGYVDMVEG